ncbi:MAG: hypothetical protein RLY16_1206 [Bacteroidota bacterium]|jgi:hypothetical protein
MRKKTIILLTTLLFTVGFLIAQTSENQKYKKESEAFRNLVWSWDKSEFSIRQLPDSFNKYSSVIIAHHTELYYDTELGLVGGEEFLGTKREQQVTEIVRELIKVNDAKAVQTYSEISFEDLSSITGFGDENYSNRYIGLRVIKPNGAITVLDASDMVMITQGRSAQLIKVAVPDLQKGDLLDIFIANQDRFDIKAGEDTYLINLSSSVPVLNYSFSAKMAPRYAIEYRSFNGAPELQVNKNDASQILLNCKAKNLKASEQQLWAPPSRQHSFIKLNLSVGSEKRKDQQLGSNKPGEVYKNRSIENVLKEITSRYGKLYTNFYQDRDHRSMRYGPMINRTKTFTRKAKLKFDDFPTEQKIAWLIYSYRFYRIFNEIYSIYGINAGKLMDKYASSLGIALNYEWEDVTLGTYCLLKYNDIASKITLAPQNKGSHLDETMNEKEVLKSVYVPSINKYVSFNSFFDDPFQTPSNFDQQEEIIYIDYDNPDKKSGDDKYSGMATITKGKPIKSNNYLDNYRNERIQISLIPNELIAKCKRNTRLKGAFKRPAQESLILFEDYYDSERKMLQIEESLLDEMKGDRDGRKLMEEVMRKMASGKESQRNAIKLEAEGFFDQEVKAVTSYKLDSLGIHHTNTDFIFSSEISLGGVVKKAGNNLILEIGKMQGKVTHLSPGQRTRNIDVYRDYAFGNEFSIEIEVPEGYVAEGVEALNKKVENETGCFISTATKSANSIIISIKHNYFHSLEPLKNWDKLLAVIDAASDWQQLQLLFKKGN